MLSTVPTIKDSFKRKLCQPRIVSGPAYRHDHSPTGHAVQMPPPKIVYSLDPNCNGGIFDISRQTLHEKGEMRSLEERMPQDEPDLCIITEGDVMAIARLSLVHPVNIVARAALKKNGRLECRQQKVMGGLS